MGGFFLDVFLVYFFRILVRLVRRKRSKAWPVAPAIVTALERFHGIWSGTTANVIYAYELNGDIFTGTDQRPFLSSDAASDYLSRYIVGSRIAVRVNPDRQWISLLADADQEITL